ncbi:hypothetical protein [Pedobacter sp. NJ-S-72]
MKNIVFLTDGRTAAVATAISISGTDIYVAGYEYNGDKNTAEPVHSQKSIAKYWKNGIPVVLTDGHANASATAITVKGTDVYVAGHEKDEISVARYWKNGKQIALKIDSNLSNGANYSEAYSFFYCRERCLYRRNGMWTCSLLEKWYTSITGSQKES